MVHVARRNINKRNVLQYNMMCRIDPPAGFPK